MNFAAEEYSLQLIADMMPLWKAHHAETADKFYGPLNPDLFVYEQAAEAGMMRIFTVRDEVGSLHGYQVLFVSHHPHSRDSLQAVQDVLYLCQDARKGLVGYRFIKWCGEQLRAEGIDIVHQHISAKHDFGAILTRMGYELEDLVYSKRLQEVG